MNRDRADDRLEGQINRLADQVERLAAQVAALALPMRPENPSSMTADLAKGASTDCHDRGEPLRRPRVPLPDPRLVRQIIRQRRLRSRYFEASLFADPAWDIMLELTAARAEHRRVSVTSLCIAADVPATTALRWIAEMTQMGLLRREQDGEDRRRSFLTLSDDVAAAMARYFDELGTNAARLI